jgi:hypothetical protein
LSAQSPRLVFAGPARNVARDLAPVLATIAAIGADARIADWHYIFTENDSEDETVAILTAFDAQHQRGIVESGSSLLKTHPRRTARIALQRNRIIHHLVHNPRFADADFLVMMDFDEVNADLAAEDVITRVTAQTREWDALFANQLPTYYDIWALRHPTWCPEDCIAQIRNRPFWMRRETAKQKFVRNRQITLDPSSPLLAVESAFGGLGIYDMRLVRQVGQEVGEAYCGLDAKGHEICDHVSFHAALRKAGGRLFIDPALINRRSAMTR